MAPTGTVRIWWDQDTNAYRMVSPYSKEFLDTFKLLFPASERVFDFGSKTWTFTEKILPNVVELVEKLFHTKATVITKGMSQKATTPPAVQNAPLDTVIAAFVRMVPYESMQRAYRHAATMLHPDHPGGDMEQMSKMNAAWQRLEKELYKK